MSLFEQQSREFISRHIGPNEKDTAQMLKVIGEPSMESLIGKTVPQSIRMNHELRIPAPVGEFEYLELIKQISLKNKIFKNYIGQGYYDTIVPSVILRNVFENPGWYTQYTPYQAEISQGRLESLLNFQTMVCDLTGLPLSNASLLDEATAAAEAMTLFLNVINKDHDHLARPKFFVDSAIFPQTKEVLRTRAIPVGIELVEGDYTKAVIDETYFGAILQYPNDEGSVNDYREFISRVHDAGALVAMATDLLALCLLHAQSGTFAGAKAGDERSVDGVKLVWCPAGSFRMGSPPNEPGRRPDEEQRLQRRVVGEALQPPIHQVACDGPRDQVGPQHRLAELPQQQPHDVGLVRTHRLAHADLTRATFSDG